MFSLLVASHAKKDTFDHFRSQPLYLEYFRLDHYDSLRKSDTDVLVEAANCAILWLLEAKHSDRR